MCKDGFLIRSAFFSQVLASDMSLNLDFSQCFDDASQCSTNALKNIDSSSICDSRCNTASCEYCMGLSNLNSYCTRSYNNTQNHCLLCSNSYQIHDLCTSSCPPGYGVINELTPVFLNTLVCLKTPEKSTKASFFTIFVNETGTSTGQGTLENPTNSISQAFSKSTRKFTKIFISGGSYKFARETLDNPLITNNTSPLSFIINFNLEELLIEGDSTRPKIFTYGPMTISSQFTKLTIKNIIIDGRYSLISNCNYDTCTYCPYIKAYNIDNNIQYYDDRGSQIYNIQNYAQNCKKFYSINFITINYNQSLFFELVDVQYFQQQYSTFINSLGVIVNFTNTNFFRVQTHSTNA